MVCTALTVAAGELAIALGWVKTMVAEPEGHGLAVLEVAGTCAVIWILAYNQREKELVEGSLRQSERRFRALVQHASDIILVVASDGTVSYASPAFESVLGYSTHESVGMLMNTIMDDEDVDRFGAHRRRDAGRARRRPASETRLRHHDGSWRWFEVTFTNLFDDPSVEGWVANLRDISERKQSEAALRQAQEVFRHAFDEAGIGMTLVDPSGRIIRVERGDAADARLRRRRRARRRERRRHHASRRSPRHRGLRPRASSAARATASGSRSACCGPTARRCGSRSPCRRCRTTTGQPMFSIGQIEDITERKAFSDRLKYEAAHDAMTGLLNRASFTERVAARARGRGADRAGSPRCCSSTSTTSRSSTTASATRPATTSSSPSRNACGTRCAPATCSPASAATSSWCCARTCSASRAVADDRAAPDRGGRRADPRSATTRCS